MIINTLMLDETNYPVPLQLVCFDKYYACGTNRDILSRADKRLSKSLLTALELESIAMMEFFGSGVIMQRGLNYCILASLSYNHCRLCFLLPGCLSIPCLLPSAYLPILIFVFYYPFFPLGLYETRNTTVNVGLSNLGKIKPHYHCFFFLCAAVWYSWPCLQTVRRSLLPVLRQKNSDMTDRCNFITVG